MSLLIVGLVLFLGTHSVSIASRGWRDRRQAQLGEAAWKGLYSLLSLAGLVAITIGYGQARLEPTLLWVPPAGMTHLTLLLMLPVFPLFMAAYLPGRILSKTKHPMLLATKIWALSHLLANGMLHDLLLFGSLLIWAGLARMSASRRNAPPPPGAPPGPWNDAIAVGVGLAFYVVFLLWGHSWLMGVVPAPFLL